MDTSAAIAALPAPLADIAGRHLSRIRDRLAEDGASWPPALAEPALAAAFARVLAGSDYVADQCVRLPGLLAQLLAGGDLARSRAPGEMAALTGEALAACADEDALHVALRRLRQREMVRIIWRDLAGDADLAETVRELSDLADALIDGALARLAGWAEAELGVPTGEQSGRPQRLVVIGMGKLGAHELNLSSDIDLIFAYPEEGECRGGRRELSNHEFFTRLGRRLIKALDAVTGDGFCFRVDMRLRPWGNSGALAAGFDAMEQYYEEQGRPWERYAMIKARIVAGDLVAGDELLARLRPFVYRRYIDYSAFEALRELKSLISREVRRKGMEHDVKLGPGGIREVEFIGQAFQLIRGGVDRRLQERALLPVLALLVELKLMEPAVERELAGAYVFLRRTEHRLQAVQDAQTQSLPGDETGRLRLAFAMGHAGWEAFMAALDEHRARVQKHFREVIALPEDEGGAAPAAGDDVLDLWLDRLPAPAAGPLLASLGIAGEAAQGAVLEALARFRGDRALAHLQSAARERLDRLMPLLLRALGNCADPGEALGRLLGVVAAVLRRSAYMVLLIENPAALAELVRLCAASPWISEEVARHPALLDELLNAGTLYAPPQLADLRDDLRRQLARVPQDDVEQQMEVLRHFKRAHVLKVAASDLMGTLPLMKVSDYLTWIAEAVLGEVLEVAWHSVAARHGVPGDADGRPLDGRGFAIIAYGKLGGLELSYGSDLDLVFLYDAPADGMTGGERALANEQFYTRLVQRIINILTTRTFSGELYEVDMRLRPSGASGLLVSSLAAFRRYQEEGAWTWEHQALARARAVAGDPAVVAGFDAIRAQTLGRRREPARLAQEVLAMRDKMIGHLSLAADKDASDGEKATQFDVKHDPGGIVDIEFMVQYAVLRWSCDHPELARYTDNVRQLDAIAACGLKPAADVDLLRSSYLAFRAITHRQALARANARVSAEAHAQVRAQVRALWDHWFNEQPAGAGAPAANTEE